MKLTRVELGRLANQLRQTADSIDLMTEELERVDIGELHYRDDSWTVLLAKLLDVAR